MLPIFLGIAAKVAGTAISAWQAAAIGAGIGAVGTNLMKNNQHGNDVIPEDDDELEELVKFLKERRRRIKKKV